MEQRYFVVKAEMPREPAIKAALAKTYPLYATLDEYTEDCVKEWKYYNRRYGWSLKVTRRKKPLYWIIVYSGYFQLGFSMTEAEREEFLAMDIRDSTRHAIEDAEKFPEGLPVQFSVKDQASFDEVFAFVKRLIELRA